ncbi:hypothetical protein M9458_039745, partial [Cirrhinus mrigala]
MATPFILYPLWALWDSSLPHLDNQVLLHQNLSVKKVQFICTIVFLLWGFLVHLIFPAFVFMKFEEWTYLEGLYFSFTTLTTVGFGDYVA